MLELNYNTTYSTVNPAFFTFSTIRSHFYSINRFFFGRFKL
uniref:Uncharacterized protein n=1 Tax=Vibrio parahaemolyticus TaxID=670 RepID=A0A1L7NY84_VIBPH|nr:hypothetical protein [Vibrio parahaemolyticus]